MNDYDDLNLGDFFDNALKDDANNTNASSSGDSRNVSDHSVSQSDGSLQGAPGRAPGAPPGGPPPLQPGGPQPGPPNGPLQQHNDHHDGDDDDNDDGRPRPPQPSRPPQQPNRNLEQDLDTIFNFGNRPNIPQGPQETSSDRHGKRADKAIKALGYIGDAFGLASGAGKVGVKGVDELTKPTEPDPAKSTNYEEDLKKYNEDKKAYDAEKERIETHNTAMNWGHIGAGLVKVGAGVTGMVRHGKKATAAKGRNRIVYRQSSLASVSAACKTVAGGMQIGTGAEGLKDNSKAAGIFSIVGSSFGLLSGTLDTIGSGVAAKRYHDITKLKGNKTLKGKADASHTKDNTILKVNEMAGLSAGRKRNRNIFSSIASGIGTLGSLAGLAAPIVGLAGGSRVASGILGLVASGTSVLTRAANGIADKAFTSGEQNDRKGYVTNYLTKKINKIKTKASAGVIDQAGQQIVPGINLDDNQARRVALKQLGIYNGAIMNTSQDVNINNNDVINDIYNKIVMKRAKKLHDLGTGGNQAGGNIVDQDVQNALEKLGLNKDNATVDEIAMAMGYKK
ncbi:MAG: hypothetical protein IK093_01315 [Ruminiclostridium sp.]|nr:hypothetical protein [Ruminiclostridium sp.]